MLFCALYLNTSVSFSVNLQTVYALAYWKHPSRCVTNANVGNLLISTQNRRVNSIIPTVKGILVITEAGAGWSNS